MLTVKKTIQPMTTPVTAPDERPELLSPVDGKFLKCKEHTLSYNPNRSHSVSVETIGN